MLALSNLQEVIPTVPAIVQFRVALVTAYYLSITGLHICCQARLQKVESELGRHQHEKQQSQMHQVCV